MRDELTRERLHSLMYAGWRAASIDADFYAEDDAFLTSGMVEPERLRALVKAIPEAAYANYPSLSRAAILQAIDEFLR